MINTTESDFLLLHLRLFRRPLGTNIMVVPYMPMSGIYDLSIRIRSRFVQCLTFEYFIKTDGMS